MNAIRLNVRWMDVEAGQPFPVSVAVTRPSSLVRLGAEPETRRCPHCNSVVYSRRHERCGACERPLPPSCRFSEQEAEQVLALFQWEREQHRHWLKRTGSVELW